MLCALSSLLLCVGYATAMQGAPEKAAEGATETEPARLAGWERLAALEFPRDTNINYRETRNARLLRQPIQAQGELRITSDDALIMRVSKPRTEERRLQADRLTLIRGDRTRSTLLKPADASHQLLLTVQDILGRNTSALAARFELEVLTVPNAGQQGWSFALVPRELPLGRKLQRLVLKGRDRNLLSLRAESSIPESWQQIEILPGSSATP